MEVEILKKGPIVSSPNAKARQGRVGETITITHRDHLAHLLNAGWVGHIGDKQEKLADRETKIVADMVTKNEANDDADAGCTEPEPVPDPPKKRGPGRPPKAKA